MFQFALTMPEADRALFAFELRKAFNSEQVTVSELGADVVSELTPLDLGPILRSLSASPYCIQLRGGSTLD